MRKEYGKSKNSHTNVYGFLVEGDGYSAPLDFPTALSGERKIFVARDFAVQLPLALGCSDEPFDGSHPSFNRIKKDTHSDVFLVEGDGFEPSKQDATDLQSAPFGHSGTPPYSIKKVELVMGLEPATC